MRAVNRPQWCNITGRCSAKDQDRVVAVVGDGDFVMHAVPGDSMRVRQTRRGSLNVSKRSIDAVGGRCVEDDAVVKLNSNRQLVVGTESHAPGLMRHG